MIRYISPTQFMLWRSNPIAYWMKYLAPEELKSSRSPQTPQMAVGNVFDTHIKYHLAESVGKELPPDLLETSTEGEFLGKSSPDKRAQLVLWEGLRAFHAYRDSPALGLLLDGLTNIELSTSEVVHVEGVPIWGKPDAELFRKKKRITQDWKVSGAFASYTPTAEPGWNYRFVKRPAGEGGHWVDLGPHHRSLEPMELINERWAVQLIMYAWMLGDSPGAEIHGQIDKVLLLDDSVEVYVYNATFTRDFQRRVIEELKLMWSKVLADEILPPELRGAPPGLLMAMI